MKNGNQELEIQIVQFDTEIRYEKRYDIFALQGWSGSAKINGYLYTGDFGIKEVYTIDDEEYEINWEDVLLQEKFIQEN